AFRFCDPIKKRWGWDYSGSSNMEELRELIKPYYVRYAKREVLKDLPPTIFTDMPVELHGEYESEYKMAMNNLVEYLKKIRKKTDKETKKSMQAEKLVLLNELRQITSMSKIIDAEEIIENIISSGEKVIVFSNFHEPLKKLHEKFKNNSVILLGNSSDKDREDAKNRFQNNENIKVFFGGTRASGIGITLNRSENVLFIDQPWTAADYEQAYSRAERMGNKAEVINIRTMYVKDSIDEKITEIIKRKKDISDFIFDANYDTNIVNEVIKKLTETPEK
ncbi:MAG: DEAD/DEAH box helicase, partial [Candidatus Paceibacterota bacterium]